MYKFYEILWLLSDYLISYITLILAILYTNFRLIINVQAVGIKPAFPNLRSEKIAEVYNLLEDSEIFSSPWQELGFLTCVNSATTTYF